MSNRVMTLLSEYASECEIYSIDEIFLNFHGMDHFNLKEYGTEIVKTIEKSTGIPVCLGVAPTKTLAKLANRFAKKFPAYKRVCLIDNPEKREKALKLTEAGDVWGIGRRYADKLSKFGVKSAWDFSQLSKSLVRKQMSIVGERIWRELHGESCLPLESVQPDKKQICTSRSFGQPVTELDDLSFAVANFAGQCAYKLRRQNSAASSLMVFIATNWFNKNLPQYHNSKSVTLPVPSSSTTEVVKFARFALEKIYRPHFQYKKAGVIITEITNADAVQGNIFYQTDLAKHDRLMVAIDNINNEAGRNIINVAAAGKGKSDMLRNKLSPRYSTRVEDLLRVKP